MSTGRDPHVTMYLDSFLPPRKVERVRCCGTSRSLFCEECGRLLIPLDEWPSCLRDGSLRLPFHLHIILDDDRSTATGMHAVALLRDDDVKLADVARGDEVGDDTAGSGTTYLLFPSADSVPLSSVEDLSTLVVLDCKWTKTSCSESVRHLPKVHLSSPPSESHFWRSHTAGSKHLSTIEAIYYAAMERDDNANYIHLLWVFALQRAAIYSRGPWKDRSLPFTESGKEEQRARRRKNKDEINKS